MTRSLIFFHKLSAAAIMMTFQIYGTYWQMYLAKPHVQPEAEYLEYEE